MSTKVIAHTTTANGDYVTLSSVVVQATTVPDYNADQTTPITVYILAYRLLGIKFVIASSSPEYIVKEYALKSRAIVDTIEDSIEVIQEKLFL